MTFALDGAGDLVAFGGRLRSDPHPLVSAAAGPGAGEVIYTYSATLSQPLEHAERGVGK